LEGSALGLRRDGGRAEPEFLTTHGTLMMKLVMGYGSAGGLDSWLLSVAGGFDPGVVMKPLFINHREHREAQRRDLRRPETWR
jgi:hypothetical protein